MTVRGALCWLRDRRQRACAALAALLAFAATPAFAGDGIVAEGFRRLEIAGRPVNWKPFSTPQRLSLTFAVLDGPRTLGPTGNCAEMQAADPLLIRSKLSADAMQAAAVQAFAQWSAVTDIDFTPAASASVADIIIGTQSAPTGIAYTRLEIDPESNGPTRRIIGAAICLNADRTWKIGFDGNLTRYDLVHVLTHEIGHALGLDHPGARGHVMAFRYLETQRTLTPGDIAGAVAIYGPRRTIATPDTSRAALNPLPGSSRAE